jgi:thiamine monophosphate synthase
VVVLTDRRLAAGRAGAGRLDRAGSQPADRRALGSLPADQRALVAVVAAAVDGGARWVVLRERDLPESERRTLADVLRALLPPGRLIVAGPNPLGGAAVHLAATELLPDDAAGGGCRLVGRSCHSADELARLSIEDYATLSPIFPTVTKPGYGPPLWPAGAERLVAGVGGRSRSVPWLALGGVDSPPRAAACGRAGAIGVAVLGAVMRADDPGRAVRELDNAFGAARRRLATTTGSGA